MHSKTQPPDYLLLKKTHTHFKCREKKIMTESPWAVRNPSWWGVPESILVWRTEREDKGTRKEGRSEGRKGGRKQILIQPRSVGANSILRENRLQLFTDALWNLASSLFLLLLNYLSAPQAASFVSTLPIIVILMWPRSLCVQSRY